MDLCIICFEKCINNVNECNTCKIYLCEACIVKWYIQKKQKICPVCKNYIKQRHFRTIDNIHNIEINSNNTYNIYSLLLFILIKYYFYL